MTALSTPLSEPDLTRRMQDAVVAYQRGNAGEAETLCRTLLRTRATYAPALGLVGVITAQRGRLEEAEDYLRRALEQRPGDTNGLFHYAGVALRLKVPAKALAAYDRAVAIRPDDPQLHMDHANLLGAVGALERALESYRIAARLRPEDARFRHGMGLVLYSFKRMAEAAQYHAEAIRLRPDYVEALNDRGIAVHALGRFAEAVTSYDSAIRLRSDYAEAHYNRANALCELGRYEEAVASYREAIDRGLQRPQTYNNMGAALQQLGRMAEALEYLRLALTMSPGYAEAWYNQGLAFGKLQRYEEALASHERAFALKPGYLEALVSRGTTLMELRRPAEARPLLEQALKMDPKFPWLRGGWLYARLYLCEWSGWEEEIRHLADEVGAGLPAAMPLIVVNLLDSTELQLRGAQTWVEATIPKLAEPPQIEAAAPGPRIRVGYFSADFHSHPVGILTAGMLEHHDRERFEVFAFSFGPETGDPVRERLRSAVEHFLDVNASSEEQIVERARALGLDIAVDLQGFTARHRAGIFARRAAPVQVSYLGYAGTLGATFMDYLIADRVIVSPERRGHYTEKIVYLPHCFQANDRTRQISDHAFTRAELDLPQDAFVFCCFNNVYKIQPAIFGRWMRILRRVPGSVLWLTHLCEPARANLRAEAERHGVDPRRLIFAARMPRMADHLARHRAADLFLDTLPFNAHTTASDALWAGLPLLSIAGESIAGRVAASLLATLGLHELIAASAEQYEELAVTLAQDPARLAALRSKLAEARLASPLFDTEGFTRRIESAYEVMVERCRRSLPLEHLEIDAG